MDCVWLPLQEPAVRGLVTRTRSALLPNSCSVSALRSVFVPFPLALATPLLEPRPPTTVSEALTGRPLKRQRREQEEMIVRELKRADVDAVRELHDENLPLSYPASFYTLLLTIPTSLCLIATTGSSILGAVSARLSPASFDPLSTCPSIYVISLVVAPCARQQGLAKKLFLEILRALVASLGQPKRGRQVQVTLHAQPAMVPFYQKLGLKEVARVRGYYRRLGNGEAAEMRGMVSV